MKKDRIDRIAVITRLHYDEHDPKFMERIFLYKTLALTSLRRQTDQDFDIYIWAEEHHRAIIESIDPRIKVFTAKWERRTGTKGRKYFIDYTEFDKVKGLPKFATVVSLDSDDELDPNGIAEIRKIAQGPERKAISFQPIKRDLRTDNLYRMKSYEEKKKISPIFALYQPTDPYLFIYQYGHYSGMPKEFAGKINYIGEGRTFMNIHDNNESTKVISEDELI